MLSNSWISCEEVAALCPNATGMPSSATEKNLSFIGARIAPRGAQDQLRGGVGPPGVTDQHAAGLALDDLEHFRRRGLALGRLGPLAPFGEQRQVAGRSHPAVQQRVQLPAGRRDRRRPP